MGNNIVESDRGKTRELNNREYSKRVDIRLTPYYTSKFIYMKSELGMSDEQLVTHLIDIYNFEDGESFLYVRRAISRRIRRGIGLSLISQMRLLYNYLGQILSRLDT